MAQKYQQQAEYCAKQEKEKKGWFILLYSTPCQKLAIMKSFLGRHSKLSYGDQHYPAFTKMKNYIAVARHIGTRGNSPEDFIQLRVMIRNKTHCLCMTVSHNYRNKSYDVHTYLDKNAIHAGEAFLFTVTSHQSLN